LSQAYSKEHGRRRKTELFEEAWNDISNLSSPHKETISQFLNQVFTKEVVVNKQLSLNNRLKELNDCTLSTDTVSSCHHEKLKPMEDTIRHHAKMKGADKKVVLYSETVDSLDESGIEMVIDEKCFYFRCLCEPQVAS